MAKIKRPNASIVAAFPIFLERRNCSLASRGPENFGCGFHVRADQATTAAIRSSKRAFSVFKHLQLFQPIISHKPVISPAAACLPRKEGILCRLFSGRGESGREFDVGASKARDAHKLKRLSVF